MKPNLLDKLEGNWKYQKTLYSVKIKKNINQKDCINILKLNLENKNIYKINYNYPQYLVNIVYDGNNVQIEKNNTDFIYTLKIKQPEKMTLSYHNSKVNFEEFFYMINVNFFIVISILKQYNKCIYISFTSFIKIL